MLAVIAMQRAHAQTPVEWPVAAGGNGHWYEIVPLGGPSDLAVAEYAAQMRRGRLAELESAGEHGFVVAALAAGAAEGSAFLGARRRPTREPHLLDASRDAFAWLRDAASARMVDVVLIGDSNVAFSGLGWDHGLQHALHASGSPCAAIGPTPFNDDGGTVGWRWGKSIGPAQQWPATLGNHASSTANAPPLLAAEMDFPLGFPNTGTGYAWLSGGSASIGGGLFLSPAHPFLAEGASLEVRFEHGRLPKGGHFTPSAWRNDGSAVVSAPTVSCASKSFSMGEALLQVPGSHSAGQWLRFTIDGGQGVQAPLFLGWTTIERAGLSHGWCVSVLDWNGGATSRRIAEDIESFDGQTASRWVAAIRSRQLRHGSGVRVVFLVSSGMNDFGLTVDQHGDALRRMMAHLSARWIAGGGSPSEVRFVLMTSHDPWMHDPTAHIVALRQRSREIAAERSDAATIDLGAIPMNPSYYEGGATGSPHLSQAGYEAMASHILSALDGSQGDGCAWRWRAGGSAEIPVDDAGLQPCTRALAAFGAAPLGVHGVREDAMLPFALLEYSDDCDGDGMVDRGAVAQGLAADANGNAVPDACECMGDLDQNAAVDSLDLSTLLSRWGQPGGVADLDASGLVDAADLVIVLTRWGPCAPG